MMPWKCDLGGSQNLALYLDLYFRKNFDLFIVNKRFFIEIHPEYLIWAVDQSEGM